MKNRVHSSVSIDDRCTSSTGVTVALVQDYLFHQNLRATLIGAFDLAEKERFVLWFAV